MIVHDSVTSANEKVSPLANEWARGLLTTIRTAADLTEKPVELIEDLIAAGKVRVERIGGQRRVRVDDVLAAAGGTS